MFEEIGLSENKKYVYNMKDENNQDSAKNGRARGQNKILDCWEYLFIYL